MEVGVLANIGDSAGLAGLVSQVRSLAEAGVRTVWFPQLLGVDALTAIALAGRQVPDVTLGTAVVPTWPRHPMVLAGQALTTQAAVGGRLVLGVGLSHQLVIEGMMHPLRASRPSHAGLPDRAAGSGQRRDRRLHRRDPAG